MASIANMLTITRIHNSISAAAAMRRHDRTQLVSLRSILSFPLNYAVPVGCVGRVVQLARDYATRRTAFGKLLKDHALHTQTLARMEVR